MKFSILALNALASVLLLNSSAQADVAGAPVETATSSATTGYTAPNNDSLTPPESQNPELSDPSSAYDPDADDDTSDDFEDPDDPNAPEPP